MVSPGNGKERRIGFFPFGRRREETRLMVEGAYDSALAAYRTWHGIEGRRRDIIDFDLTEGPTKSERLREEWTHSSPTLEERRRIAAGLEIVLNEIESLPTPAEATEQHKHRFALAQIRASLTFARLRAGQEFDYKDLIENTLGANPSEIPPEVLDHQHQIVMNRWEDWHKSETNPPLNPSQEDMDAWKAENQLSVEDTVSKFNASVEQSLLELSRFLGDGIIPEVDVFAVNEPEYFWAWSDRQDGRYRIRLNFSQKRNKLWTPGKIEELAPHEAQAHIGRMARREKSISDGKLHPFFGLTTVHGPEAVVEEGLGVTMVKFIPGSYKALSPEGKFQVESTILKHLVLGALQVRLNGSNPPTSEQAVAFVKRYLPWENPEEIKQQAKEMSQDPKYKIYRLAYAIGTWTHLVYTKTLNREGRRMFLQKLSLPFTPRQEVELWESLVQQDRYRHDNAYQALDFIDPSFLPRR